MWPQQQGRPPTKYMKPACCQHDGYLSRYYILFQLTRERETMKEIILNWNACLLIKGAGHNKCMLFNLIFFLLILI